MTTLERVKGKVRNFQLRTNFGIKEEDNFTPWWIQQKYRTSDEEATYLSAEGNYDYGLDGFHLMIKPERNVLTIIQAKFTDDINQIRKGIHDINRFIPELQLMIEGLESDNKHYQENLLKYILKN